MTWTAPKTWVVGEVLTAAALNTHVRDNEKHLLTVCTSASRPTSGLAVGQRIYETDTFRTYEYQGATTGWTQPWGLPWGEVGYAEITADTSAFGSAISAIGGLSIAVTTVANRKYQINGAANMDQAGSTATPILYIFEQTAGQLAAARGSLVVGYNDPRFVTTREVPGSGAKTYTLRASVEAGTVTVRASSTMPAFIQMIDIGPSGNPL